MRRLSLGLAAVMLVSMAACGGDEPEPPEEMPVESSEPSAEAAAPAADAETTSVAAAESDASQTEAMLAAPGAPDFAVIYPGGVINEDTVEAEGEPGPEGIVTYLTTASPDEVIAFHRARAEAKGLASVLAMNQGDARAYGAHDTDNGANLSVFATPNEQGGASVQLVWSAGE